MERSYWSWSGTAIDRRTALRRMASGGIGASALFLLACSGSKGTNNSNSAAATKSPTGASPAAGGAAPTRGTAAAASTAAGGSPAAGGTAKDGSYYSVAAVLAGTTMDIDRELYRQVAQTVCVAYSNLVIFDDVTKGTIVGDLTQGMPEQPDSQTYVFNLRSGVKWQNKAPANGRDLTMDDIKFNVDRQMTQKLADGTIAKNMYRYSTIYQYVDSVQYMPDGHISFKLKAPRGPWLSTMCDDFNGIQYPDVVLQEEKDFATITPDRIVGTGGYVFTQYDLSKGATAVRNPTYFKKLAGEPVAFFDKIQWVNLGSDVNAMTAAFQQKQIDMFGGNTGLTPQIVSSVAQQNKAAIPFQVGNPNSNLELGYNYSQGTFANPNIRKAIFLAIDRDLVVQQAFGGLGRPNAAIPWQFTDWALPQEELLNTPGYRKDKAQDIKDAKQMWDAGGGPALGTIEFVIVDAADQSIKEWWPAMMNKNLGTNQFSVRSIPISSLLAYDTSGNSTGYLGGWDQWISPDPRDRFNQAYGKDGSINFWHYSSTDMQSLLDKAFAELDRTKAIAIMRDAQRVALNDGGAGHWQMAGALTPLLRWPYLHRLGPDFIPNEKELETASYIDQSDPTFKGKPAE